MSLRSEVKESLKLQLELQGSFAQYKKDMIDDYMSMWDTKNQLQKDIKARGVVYSDVSSVGVVMQKNNPSVKELVMVNRQMLAILKDLNLNVPDIRGEEDDEM